MTLHPFSFAWHKYSKQPAWCYPKFHYPLFILRTFWRFLIWFIQVCQVSKRHRLQDLYIPDSQVDQVVAIKVRCRHKLSEDWGKLLPVILIKYYLFNVTNHMTSLWLARMVHRAAGRYIWAVTLVSQELITCTAPAHENINGEWKNEPGPTATTLSQELLRDRLTCLFWSFMRIFDNIEMGSSIPSGVARGTLLQKVELSVGSTKYIFDPVWTVGWITHVIVIFNDNLAKQESHINHPILSFI